MSLKEEIADLFIAREQTQQHLAQINQQLQQKVNQLQNEEKKDARGNKGESE